MSQTPKIPRAMSTQHPDNVNTPFFTANTELGGEDEIQEAYYAFSHLGCDEQMWDCEGKEVDNFVVKKLLSRYGSFFMERKLGRDLFITLRVPNPTVEKAEAKVLLETLESIPRSFDAAKIFYKEDIPPIFEVILPMTASVQSVNRVYRYYRDFVAGKQDRPIGPDDIRIIDWIGEFKPQTVNVIPLFEDKMQLEAHSITRAYLEDKRVDYQRVFLARSDPAMNYGLVSAVLLNKIALQRLGRLSKETGVRIDPIIGMGSAPFRGNLRPQTVDRILKEYPSVRTFTVQSAFKYDHAPEEVIRAIRKIENHVVSEPQKVDEARALEILDRYSQEYRRQIMRLAPIVNRLAKYIPGRRKRKLHIGLFGYSRNIKGVTLPRVITFTAALYSIGLPPEVLGLNALTPDDLRFIKKIYVNFEEDLKDVFRRFNPDGSFVPPELRKAVSKLSFGVSADRQYKQNTDHVLRCLEQGESEGVQEHILRAADLRKFLG